MDKPYLVEHDIAIPMRDGTILRGEMYRPSAPGRYPVVIERVPYELVNRCADDGDYYASRGYVFIGQNVRGAFYSEGRFTIGEDDAWGANRDGYDTVEWAAEQPWSSGRVALLGGSYSGFTQYLVAPTRPPHLSCLYARMGPSSNYADMTFQNGAYGLPFDEWSVRQMLYNLTPRADEPTLQPTLRRLERAFADAANLHDRLPVASMPAMDGLADWYFGQFSHYMDGPYWWPTDATKHWHQFDVPIVHFGGWFDIFLESSIRAWQGVRANGLSPRCRNNQRLIIGPWMHGPETCLREVTGELDFGSASTYDIRGERRRWYDHWLKDEPNGVEQDPPVEVFLMGDNRWVSLNEWPPANARYKTFYLRQGTGRSSASLNNGGLTWAPPLPDEAPDSAICDPYDPTPSLMQYPDLGPRDHSAIEGRMLTYTTDVLQSDLTVMGPIKALLYGLSTARDTDWVVRLMDVYPDGRSMSICDGFLRSRFRHGCDREELLEPGRVYELEVSVRPTAHVWKAGHCLRVEITHSDFPRYDRNLNTGGPLYAEVAGRRAVNTLFHDAARASRIILPVITA